MCTLDSSRHTLIYINTLLLCGGQHGGPNDSFGESISFAVCDEEETNGSFSSLWKVALTCSHVQYIAWCSVCVERRNPCWTDVVTLKLVLEGSSRLQAEQHNIECCQQRLHAAQWHVCTTCLYLLLFSLRLPQSYEPITISFTVVCQPADTWHKSS